MPGRKRNPQLDEDILAAAGELVRDAGYACCTIEAVARRLGIPKTTIYTRWPTRTALLDVVLAGRLTMGATTSGEPRRALCDLVERDLKHASTSEGRALIHVVLAARDDADSATPELTAALRARHRRYSELLRRCVEDTTVTDATINLRADTLLAAVWGHALLERRPDRRRAEHLVDTVIAAITHA